jgi:hypothetical protein
MITELLGLAGSGALGSVVGMISDHLQRKHEVELAREQRRDEQTAKHLGEFSTSPAYSAGFLLLCLTYCSCAFVCFIFPDVQLLTFNPDAEPKNVSILWGFISWNFDNAQVYTITTGGVGYALLHPLAFQIGTVITGITPTKRV